MAPTKKSIKNKEKSAVKKAEKRILQISGQGGYYTDNVVPFMRRLIPDGTFAKAGGAGGGMLAGMSGVPGSTSVGSATGKYLGGQLAKLVGFGDYAVVSNTITKAGGAIPEGTQVPCFGNFGYETRVCHREFIKDIVVPASPLLFTNMSFQINAGNSALFPWLAAIAANYQQYRFNGLVFEFRTMSSDITAGGALGTVSFATDYDAIDSPYVSKIQLENSQFATSVKPSNSMIHAVECDPAQSNTKLWFTRDSVNSPTAVTDARLFDLGNFQVATTGLPGLAGQVLGELWASYDVSLLKPEIASVSPGSIEGVIASVGVSPTVVFGTTPVLSGANLYLASNSTMTILAPGSYILTTAFAGTLFFTPTFSGTATIVAVAIPGPLITMTSANFTYRVTTTAPNQTITFLTFAVTQTITVMDLISVGNNAGYV